VLRGRSAISRSARSRVSSASARRTPISCAGDLVLVRALEPEPPGAGVGPDLWPQAAQQGVHAPPGDDPSGLSDAGGKVGLDPLPLARERLLPVGLEQPEEPFKQAPRIVKQLARQRLIACRGRTLPQKSAGTRRLQRSRIACFRRGQIAPVQRRRIARLERRRIARPERRRIAWLERRRIARDSPGGLRADQRDRELQTHQLLINAAQPPQLALEVR